MWADPSDFAQVAKGWYRKDVWAAQKRLVEVFMVGRHFRSRFHPGDPKIDRLDYWTLTVHNVRLRMWQATPRRRRAR